MAIPYNRTPALVDTSNKTYRDNSNYFNHVQFKGLCDNQNVDTIDPNTFQEAENLYVDQDDTLSSRPKLKQHDNFGFDTIEKMWIWDDAHLIYGEKTIDENSVALLSDVINEVSLTLADDSLKQVVRVENRIFIFLEDDVYVYEKVEDAYTFTEVTISNLEEYFYIPAEKIIKDGIEVGAESKNEIVQVTKTTIISSDTLSLDTYIKNNSQVNFSLNGETYSFIWHLDQSYLTLGKVYITDYFDSVKFGKNNSGVIGLRYSYLFYSFDGVSWTRLPYLNFFNNDGENYGISQDGKYAWGIISFGKSDPGFYIISLTDDLPLQPGERMYPEWTRIISAQMAGSTLVYDGHGGYGTEGLNPSVDMVTWCDWVIAYSTHTYNSSHPDWYDKTYNLAVGKENNGSLQISSYSVDPDNEGSQGRDYFQWGDTKVYTTNITIGSDKLYFLFLQDPGGQIAITPFYTSNLHSPVGDSTRLFYPNDRTIGRFFNLLEGMPIFISDLETVSGSYPNQVTLYWIGKTDTLSLEGVIDEVALDYIYCYYQLKVNNSQGGTKTFTSQHLTTNDGYYTPIKYYAQRYGQNLDVKFVPQSANLFLSEIGLLKVLDRTHSWDGNTLRDCFLYEPSLPIANIHRGQKEYSLIWENNNIRYELQADTSVLAFDVNFTAFYLATSKSSPSIGSTTIVTNPFQGDIILDVLQNSGFYTNLYPQHNVETDNTQYWAFDKNLYIEDRRYTEDWKPLLYFPEINTEIRPNQITNLLVIDRGVVALFNEYEVWYVTKVTLEDSKTAYAYYKSRVGVGCKEGADIDIMYDGATIAYASPRGIVGMNYQQLTQNTDQILTFLSDNISTTYYPWYEDGQIKIFKYRFWTIFYKVGSYKCLVLDIRTASWWVWDSKIDGGFKEIYMYQDKPLILDNSGNLKEWDEGHEGIYKDMDEYVIDWMATSQPLSFGALNNYKRITSININNVQLTRDPFNYVLICRNYKDKRNVYSPKVVGFEQERITVGSYRTFVKRLNYIQSVKFQYTIANNSDLPIQSPISITAISTKYEIKGRIR